MKRAREPELKFDEVQNIVDVIKVFDARVKRAEEQLDIDVDDLKFKHESELKKLKKEYNKRIKEHDAKLEVEKKQMLSNFRQYRKQIQATYQFRLEDHLRTTQKYYQKLLISVATLAEKQGQTITLLKSRIDELESK